MPSREPGTTPSAPPQAASFSRSGRPVETSVLNERQFAASTPMRREDGSRARTVASCGPWKEACIFSVKMQAHYFHA
jgi:hypothetical protein